MPPSCALLGGFAIGARVALLWQHNANPSYKLSCTPRYDNTVRTRNVSECSVLALRLVLRLCSDGCEAAVPVEGGEACGYVDLGRSASDFDVRHLTGTWFLVAETTRFPGILLDEAVTSVAVDSSSVNFTFSFFNRYMLSSSSLCIKPWFHVKIKLF